MSSISPTGRTSYKRIGYSRQAWEDKPFYWVGPNGRDRVLYWAPYYGYDYAQIIDGVVTATVSDLDKLENSDYPYDIVQLRWTKGDNGPADERVMDEVRAWNARHPWPKLKIATTSQMFHEFESRYGPKVPVYRGDFTPYWGDGLGSAAREMAMSRRAADRLCQAETIWVVKRLGNYPVNEFDAAWKNVVMYSEHTFGASGSVATPDDPLVQRSGKSNKPTRWTPIGNRERFWKSPAAARAGSATHSGVRRRSTCSILPAGRAVKWLPFLPS